MERDEAKIILELCRPGKADDAQDPIIAEALGLLESDAELKAWFEEQQALDARISKTYNQVEPPADLKAGILAGMRAHALQSENQVESESMSGEEAAFIAGSHDKMDTPTASQTWWRNPWVGVAAVFALLFVIVVVPRGEQGTQLATVEPDVIRAGVPAMIQFLASEIDALTSKQRSLEMRSGQATTLQAYLSSTGAPSPNALPRPVSNKDSIGCITFDYKGIKMGMICFKEDELMHLTTVKKTDCMGQISEKPAIYEIRDQAFKVWVQDDQVQILSVHGGKEKLPEFI